MTSRILLVGLIFYFGLAALAKPTQPKNELKTTTSAITSIPAEPQSKLPPGTPVEFAQADNKISFVATGKPAMIKIIGDGPGPQGKLNFETGKLNGNLVIDLKKITTKIEMRDEHLKNKYLEVEKYPTAELIFKDVESGFKMDVDKAQTLTFKADFKMRDKTLPIQIKADLTRKTNEVSGKAYFTIKASDYLETLPSYAGIKVADNIEVVVDVKGIVQ